ncbi:MAG TPA: hypothetical protein VNL92_05525, partial [Dehalococcoidia bacterium]|nr:hypothetical protein [Dehalococcoidia bacterium]
APPGLSWAPPDLVMGTGRNVVVRDAVHPFAEYIDEFRKRVAYRAHFREGAAFGEGAKIFARSHGGAAVGVDIPLGAGRIVFIPPLPDLKPGTERSPVASCILDAGRKLLEMPPDEEAPEWTRSYALPGLEQKEAALAEAEEALVAAEARFEAAYRDEEDLARYRGLLWREGPWALDPIVHQAFRLLGFEVNGPPEGPAVLKADGVEIMLEVEGAPGPVDMAPHYRLRDRREQWLAERGALPRGLVVVNGERLAPPERRQHPYIDALRIASESMGYALLTATDLFGLVQHALADTGAAWRASVRRQIAEAAGPLRFDDPRAEAEVEPPVSEAAEAEPESAPEVEPTSRPDAAPARPRAH